MPRFAANLLALTVKVVAGALAVLIIALFLGFIVYDVLYFQPYRPQIAQLIAVATEEERNPPEPIVRIVRVAFGPFPRRTLANEVAVILLVELKQASPPHWHVRQLLWWACVALHVSEREQIALVASRPGQRGFSTASRLLFGRPLATLTLSEAATVVAISPAPNIYLRDPEALAKRRDWLLSKLQNGS